MPCTLCYLYSILCVNVIFSRNIVHGVLLSFHNVCTVHYFYSTIRILCATFSFPCCLFCVTFIPHCALCVTFVPQCVCVVKYFSFHILCGQHSFCSMLCVLCATFTPWNKRTHIVPTFIPFCVQCVLSLHALCRVCYFYSMLHVLCII